MSEYSELCLMLTSRNYNLNDILPIIEKVKKISWTDALKRKKKHRGNSRPVFTITFVPRLPNLATIQSKHWRPMSSQDSHLAGVFPMPSLLAYKKQSSLKDTLVRAKLPPQNLKPKRK